MYCPALALTVHWVQALQAEEPVVSAYDCTTLPEASVTVAQGTHALWACRFWYWPVGHWVHCPVPISFL